MNDWRQRLQNLHATVRAARLAEERARDAYRLAQAGRKEAERRLTAWIEAEAEPCPLFDGVAAQAEPEPASASSGALPLPTPSADPAGWERDVRDAALASANRKRTEIVAKGGRLEWELARLAGESWALRWSISLPGSSSASQPWTGYPSRSLAICGLFDGVEGWLERNPCRQKNQQVARKALLERLEIAAMVFPEGQLVPPENLPACKPAQDWCSWSGGLDGLRGAAKGWTVEQLAEAARRFNPAMPAELGVIREEQARRNPSVPEAAATTAAPTKKPARRRKPKQAGEAQPDQVDQDQGDRPEVQTWDVYHTGGRDVPLGQVEARTWERAHALAAQAWEGKTVLVVGVGEPCPQERYAGWVHPDWCRPVEIEISHFPHHNLRTVWDPDARQPLVAHLPDGRAIPLDPTGWQHLPLGHAATQLLGEALREEAPR